jgi:hypothetical protein
MDSITQLASPLLIQEAIFIDLLLIITQILEIYSRMAFMKRLVPVSVQSVRRLSARFSSGLSFDLSKDQKVSLLQLFPHAPGA